MQIQIGYDLQFDLPAPVNMLLAMFVRPELASSLTSPEYLQVEPEAPVHTYIDRFGNRIGRILAPAGRLQLQYQNVAINSGEPEDGIEGAWLHSVEELPPECIEFLLPSRYCESDKLTDIAWQLFGSTPYGWQRVKAVVDWVHNNVQFGYKFASPKKSAVDVYYERRGVCRDFQHLSIAFLRALNIPARYASGYLGDIGVPPNPSPMDFSAWFEVYLGHRWYTMDARHNTRRIGRILQTRGRDAADVALTTSFGSSSLARFSVTTYAL